jgi:hypothetical protein
MPSLYFSAEMTARFGDNFHTALDEPPPLPISLELLERRFGCYRPDMVDRLDDVLQSRNGRARRH